MPSLHDLLKQHPSILVVDSSSLTTQVGVLQQAAEPVWEAATDEAGVAVFQSTERALVRAGLPLSSIDAFVFCDGPGSVLGIRTAAVAVRTWNVLRVRPTYSFCSLALVAHALLRTGQTAPFSVIADARRDTWHRVEVDAEGRVSPLRRVAPELLSGTLLMPEGFRHWSAKPTGLSSMTPYALSTLFPKVADIDLFQEAPEPDAHLHEEPSYQTWTPQIHRAPS
jgi:tRNA threonylcarbamoyladenosine biosynthesis protein TsaB